MKKIGKKCWGISVVFSSVFILLIILLYHRYPASAVILSVVVPLLIFCFWLSWYLSLWQRSSLAHIAWRSQPEEAEVDCGDDASDEEDTPPTYEAVINKTSYEYLGANKIYVTEDVGGKHQEKEPYTDTDLPTYSEATAQSV